MSPPSLPPPPTCSPPLRVAIVGQKGSGKTTLSSHIRNAWPDPSSANPPPLHSPPRFLSRMSSSRLALFFTRAVRITSAILAHTRPEGSCQVEPFENGIAFDSSGACGVGRCKEACEGIPDVLVLVTRLDEGRVCRGDKLKMMECVMWWGKEVLERLVVVLTHGCATPVAGLRYEDFVRGRVDLIWRFKSEVLPPREIDGDGLGIWDVEDDKEEGLGGVDEEMRREEEVSVSGVRNNALTELHQEMVGADRKFEEVERPKCVVVEMGEGGGKNEWGESILPDGTVWLREVLKAIKEVGEGGREIVNGGQIVVQSEHEEGFWRKFGEMWKSLSRDGFRVLLAEVVILVCCVNVGTAVKRLMDGRRERWLKEHGDDDILFEMSDEEFEKVKGSTSGQIIIQTGEEKREEKKQTAEEIQASEEALKKAIDEEVERRKAMSKPPPNPSRAQIDQFENQVDQPAYAKPPKNGGD